MKPILPHYLLLVCASWMHLHQLVKEEIAFEKCETKGHFGDILMGACRGFVLLPFLLR